MISQPEVSERMTGNLAERALTSMTHDLKSPLVAITGLTDLLIREMTSGSAITDHHRFLLSRVLKASHSLSGLVDDIMTMSKLEAGREMVEPVVVKDLRSELEEVITTFEMEGAAKDITLRLDVAADIPHLLVWDITRLRLHALNNLMSNALRFTPRGGSVTITACSDGTHVILTVADTGPGIPEDERRHIFGRLNRGKSERVYNGAGLGLYNTRLFVERHGGAVMAEASPTGGALFVIRLPFDSRPFL